MGSNCVVGETISKPRLLSGGNRALDASRAQSFARTARSSDGAKNPFLKKKTGFDTKSST
jgi:hypothetical protein